MLSSYRESSTDRGSCLPPNYSSSPTSSWTHAASQLTTSRVCSVPTVDNSARQLGPPRARSPPRTTSRPGCPQSTLRKFLRADVTGRGSLSLTPWETLAVDHVLESLTISNKVLPRCFDAGSEILYPIHRKPYDRIPGTAIDTIILMSIRTFSIQSTMHVGTLCKPTS